MIEDRQILSIPHVDSGGHVTQMRSGKFRKPGMTKRLRVGGRGVSEQAKMSQ